jgi:argininosuccinate lyase
MRRREVLPPCPECPPPAPEPAGTLARTAATGESMLPELVAWTSSFEPDRVLTRADLVGSAAHVTMLGRAGLVPAADAEALRRELLDLFARATAGTLELPAGEEDVHMAIETELTKKLGDVGKRVHTARSRNDQVALALRLHVRAELAGVLRELGPLLVDLATWAEEDSAILPAFTHRQRAQPVSAAFLICAWAQPIARAGDVARFALQRLDRCPLGSGACSGSSLAIDRQLVADLLGFSAPTENALDTTGDRDFELDFAWAGARVLLSLSRMAQDLVDFASREFGYVRLGGQISAGSSMMPQKKNPDVFELVRGKSPLGLANLVHLLTMVKALPTGYSRDLQDDRRATLETGPLVRGTLRAVRAAIQHVEFDDERCASGLADGSTQATDLAEALVKRGVPFRDAYKAVGALVRLAADRGVPLASLGAADAAAAHPLLDASCLAVLDPRRAVEAKASAGGTAPARVAEQIAGLRATAHDLAWAASEVPTLEALAAAIEKEPLS